MMRWVGIDEAGYGPNLGPIVMTAVVAEGEGERPPDLWGDLAGRVSRAGGPGHCLWVDDSKAIYKARRGRDRLEAATLAVVDALGAAPTVDPVRLFSCLGAGADDEVEFLSWIDPPLPARHPENNLHWSQHVGRNPLRQPPWRIARVRAIVMGPNCFNKLLHRAGNKASLHFALFSRLLADIWGEGETCVQSDKHGGRNFYAPLLSGAFPDADVTAIEESAERAFYLMVREGHRLSLDIRPRADGADGLVALASILSKTLRELWMDQFNAYWAARVPGLRPSAGYPVDALRFRREIEPTAIDLGLPPESWWRIR